MTEKQRIKVTDKKAKQEARLKDKEDKKKKREEELRLKKEVSARNKELAKLVAKEGSEKLLSPVGISPLGSSMPSSLAPMVSQVPLSVAPFSLQTVHTIPCTQVKDVQCGVEVINDSISRNLELFNGITGEDKLGIWLKIQEWIKVLKENKIRRSRGDVDDTMVYLILLDVLEDLPVPSGNSSHAIANQMTSMWRGGEV